MTEVLAHELELGRGPAIELDCRLLEWLDTMPERQDGGPREMWLRHANGLVGDLTGMERLLGDLLPGALWFLGTDTSEGGTGYSATVLPAAPHSGLFVGRAPIAANALGAALLRAHEAVTRAALRSTSYSQKEAAE